MSSSRKKRSAFRPSVGGATLEDRLVLNGARAAQVSAIMARLATLPVLLTARQVHDAFAAQFRAANNDLRQAVNAQIAQLFASGAPTSQQFTDFNATVAGMVDATALRLSSQAALLPNGNNRLVPAFQNGLLGGARNSLLSRFQAITASPRFTASPTALQNALGRQVNSTFLRGHAQLANFFNTTNLNRLSVDQTGQRIPLQQFLGNGLINQFSNNLGALSQAFPNVANATLFANGATTATTAAQQAFANQSLNALNATAFQLGSGLALFPGVSNTLTPQLQSSLFGTGMGVNSLFNSLQGLPATSADFNKAVTTAFSNNFQGATSPLFPFFGLQSPQTFNLPTGPFNGAFGTSFSGNDFFNGFNGGFGSGFLGFGQSPTGFNSNFANGFNNFIGTVNPNFGFTMPTIGTGTGLGTGLGSGSGAGFGLGTGFGPGFGLGTPGVPNAGGLGGGAGFPGGMTF